MTIEAMDVQTSLEQTTGNDFRRQMICHNSQRLTVLEDGGRTGAEHGAGVVEPKRPPLGLPLAALVWYVNPWRNEHARDESSWGNSNNRRV